MKIILRVWIFGLLVLSLILLFSSNIHALSTEFSNESIQANKSLNQAEKDISEMIERNISIRKVNETYQEALQLYSAQLALEEKGDKASYELIIKHASEINSVKEVAFEADDELKVFKEAFKEAEKSGNLSEMQGEHDAIIRSFNEERFEDTLSLIDKGYNRISEIQSSQTAVNVAYLATSKAVKGFFVSYGLEMAIIGSVALFLVLIFQDKLKKLRIRRKFNRLVTQKTAINNLLKNMQKSYFKTKKMSETEYAVKLKKFKELIRDIDRQMMVLKEEMFKWKRCLNGRDV